MDVGHQRRVAFAKDNNTAIWIRYNRARGDQSSTMEHAIPESALADDTHALQGTSAATALAAAASQGRRIFTLSQANQDQVASIHQSASVMNNIRNAINGGLEVTVHDQPVASSGFYGAGYLVVDPHTGGGSYLIEGASRGGSVPEESPTLRLVGTLSTGLLDGLTIAQSSARSVYLTPPAGSLISHGLSEVIGKSLGMLTYTKAILDIDTDPNLNTLQRVGLILVQLLLGMVGAELGGLIATGLLLSPLGQVLLTTLLVAVISELLTEYLSGLITADASVRELRRKQHGHATVLA